MWRAVNVQVRVEDAELLTDYERKRQEYRERNRMSGKRETSTLDLLRSFRSKLAGAAPPSEGPLAASTAAARPEDGQVRQQLPFCLRLFVSVPSDAFIVCAFAERQRDMNGGEIRGSIGFARHALRTYRLMGGGLLHCPAGQSVLCKHRVAWNDVPARRLASSCQF